MLHFLPGLTFAHAKLVPQPTGQRYRPFATLGLTIAGPRARNTEFPKTVHKPRRDAALNCGHHAQSPTLARPARRRVPLPTVLTRAPARSQTYMRKPHHPVRKRIAGEQ